MTSVLDKHDIKYDYLEKTRDIWCRDYMPIQVSETEFIEYRYDPDYLQGIEDDTREIKTYPDIVCDNIGLKTTKSELIIDGGNVVKSERRLILTDKVVSENIKFYKPDELVEKLKDTFQVDHISIIPREPDTEEIFGHADGMVRFVDENKVLINGYFNEYDKKFKDYFFGALSDFELIELNFDVNDPEHNINWGYINFLQTKNVILLPQFGIDEDEQAFEQFKEIFPEYAKKNGIEKIDASRIIEGGGVLNCMTWNILK